jgi:hypothetical protein
MYRTPGGRRPRKRPSLKELRQVRDGKSVSFCKLGRKIKNLDQFKPADNLDMAITDETTIELVK